MSNRNELGEKDARRLQTLSVHAGGELNRTHAISPPIWQTSTFRADSPEHFAILAAAVNPEEYYTRYGNPNQAQAAQAVASLEGAEAGLVTSSGVGAIATVMLTFLKQGDHVVAQSDLYPVASVLLREYMPNWGVEVTWVEQSDVKAFESSVRPNTKLIYMETPSNPLLKLTNLRELASIAKRYCITTVVDSTFATPINQQPITCGIDIVIHSATKFLGGHSDISAGVIVSDKSTIARLWRTLIVVGAALSPFDSWLLQRGLKTLPLRVRQHNESAMRLARRLQQNERVSAVHYPGLPSHPQHALAAQQMSRFGGVLSFEVKGGFEEASRFVTRLKLATHAPSLGGPHTLVVHPASMWIQQLSKEQREAAGVVDNLIRVSVGLEDARDIIADFEMALQHNGT
jgi:methionine-gamma-lyase